MGMPWDRNAVGCAYAWMVAAPVVDINEIIEFVAVRDKYPIHRPQAA